jgi:hypothetical protein
MRIQCISRPRFTMRLPTVGMLFSDWHAMTHVPQPVHAFKSMLIPQRWPLYSTSRQSGSVRGVGERVAANDGSALYSSSVPSIAIGRPSIWSCSCVRTTRYCLLVFDTVAPLATCSASDVRSG